MDSLLYIQTGDKQHGDQRHDNDSRTVEPAVETGSSS